MSDRPTSSETPRTRLLSAINVAMADSDLLGVVATVNEHLERATSWVLTEQPRELTGPETEQLESQGNQAQAWSSVFVGSNFTPGHVRNNRFLGRVVLGSFSGTPRTLDGGPTLPTGVYDTTLQDCEIGDEAVVSRVGLISGTLLARGAAILQTASVSGGGSSSHYGCDLKLPVDGETANREIGVYAELTATIAGALVDCLDERGFWEDYQELLEDYLRAIDAPVTIIDEGAVIRDGGRIVDSYIGRSAVVRGAQLIENSSLLSTAKQPTLATDGACISGSLLQWGSRVSTRAVVTNSVLGEATVVENNASVVRSILGANSSVSQGEVTASLLGPFVAAHHRSLLIAATWTGGRGNIAAGAQVGSNHTGRAPDQSIRCGEGLFFGLGCLVKFPADFTGSPYSIIAAGVTTLPQRVEFPFSLINTPSAVVAGRSPAINELFPGWVLLHNIYMVKRNEEKHRQRDRTKQSDASLDVFRPETVRLMQVALERLQRAAVQDFYCDHDIEGLGKNGMSRSAVDDGVKAYGFYIEWYALRGLKQRLETTGLTARCPAATALLEEPSDDPRWEHQRQLLAGRTDIALMLSDLQDRERKIAEDVFLSKSRDDQRGQRILEGYADTHASAAEDPFVQGTRAALDRLCREIETLLE